MRRQLAGKRRLPSCDLAAEEVQSCWSMRVQRQRRDTFGTGHELLRRTLTQTVYPKMARASSCGHCLAAREAERARVPGFELWEAQPPAPTGRIISAAGSIPLYLVYFYGVARQYV